nr:triple gene block protein2 [Clover yellow mosaic virus]
MSGAPIHLTPPPDHSKTLLAAVVGVSLAVLVFTLTRSTLPHVGDNIHSLPHGGDYRDGTKIISYNSPRGNRVGTLKTLPLILAITLPAVIYALSHRRIPRPCNNPACPSLHNQR